MGRTRKALINILFGYVGTFATAIMSFILRTIFIHYLSAELLGVNSLYTNILSILSMAELGIGTALNFSLYGPVARKDIEKIKSYMLMYRKAYYVIAMVVAAIGLAIAPFLQYLIKEPGHVSARDLTLYYLIFLFNTVSSYFVAYKYSLVNAEQKNYIQTNINTITKVITVLLQILILVTTRNFYCYLLTDAAVQLIQKLFVNRYLNHMYPYLLDKKVTRLTKEESGEVWAKTRALVLHKVGDVARLQTDTIIISAFINVTMSGIVDNYNLVINTIANFVNIILNNVISSFGNLIATEGRQKQYDMFQVYRFVASWVYGYIVTALFVLLTPFIKGIWLGDTWVIPTSALMLILTDFYFKGDRIVLSNYKTAAGIFEPDKYLTLIQGIVNLVLSIVLVQKIGLTGIYVGTVISGLIANITKPVIIYHMCFEKKAWSYFARTLEHVAVMTGVIGICELISDRVMAQVNIATFIAMGLIITVLFNGIFFLLYGRSKEFCYLRDGVMSRLGRRKNSGK